MISKPAVTSRPINVLIGSRWSPRAFDPEKRISREHLISILEAARWAPSCFGDEPWRYIVWDKFTDAENFERAFDCLSEGNKSWVKNCPVLMVACADTLFQHNDKPNRWGGYDTGAASVSMAIQAVEFGIYLHQMGGFDKNKLREIFQIPERFEPMAMIAVGYQGSLESLDEKQREKETAERKRKPLSERFFIGEWGNGIE